MNKTASQFAYECIGYPLFLPNSEKEKAPETENICWLCAGKIKAGAGWDLKRAISKTFTNHNQAKCLTSKALCPECVAFMKKPTWSRYVEDHPDEDLKDGKPMGWNSYSHIFFKNTHISPNRIKWREYLLNPPKPPFLFSVTTTGKKHLIFRGKVAHSKDVFPVKFEEEDFIVDRVLFKKCLLDFELMYDLGFSKASILSGEYNQAQIIKTGVKKWDLLEQKIKHWRANEKNLIRLVEFCAQKTKDENGK